MSKHKKKGVVAAQTGIVVGDGKHHHRRYNLRFRAMGLIVVAVVVLAAIISGVVYGVNKLKDRGSNHAAIQQPRQAPEKPKLDKPQTPEQQVEQYVLQGNYNAAQKVYDKQLTSVTDKKAKAGLYSGKSTVALDAQDYKNALIYEKKAEALQPTSGTAQALGYIASLLGDNTSAKVYYTTALNRLDKGLPTYAYQANKIQEQIDGVSK